MKTWLAPVCLPCSLLVLFGPPYGRADPTIEGKDFVQGWPSDACTIDDLIPDLEGNLDERWTYDSETAGYPVYDCTCQYLKCSYYCPHGRTDIPAWKPQAVADGRCTPVSEKVFESTPLPPNSTVLIYGNSHLRQVFEAIFCLYKPVLTERKLMSVIGNLFHVPQFTQVEQDRQCRGIVKHKPTTFVEDGCITEEERYDAYRCGDDRAEYVFENGGKVHYYFAHEEYQKSVLAAFEFFGTSASDYDLVIANNGNMPRMSVNNALISAQTCHDDGVPFLWLSTYDGHGAISGWSAEDKEIFYAAHARHVPIHRMVQSMTAFTRSEAEGEYADYIATDHHYCLPGPPNELSKLMLKLVWASQIEQGKV